MSEMITGGFELLDRIRPLWEKLNRHHANISNHFSEQILSRTFSQRKKELMAKSMNGKIRVDISSSGADNRLIGYCVSTIQDNIGEIDSIYVVPAYRKKGLGKKMMKRAISWLDHEKVDSKFLVVLYGNEDVFKFYNRFGFVPRSANLVQVPQSYS